ncbi:MAG TPA: response regulator [Bacteroidales bacterium]|nr:response regulator [Bacteroidales bacterium]
MKEKPRILIVDDHVNNIYVVEELLSEMEVEILRATSGREAIGICAREDLALVLMDVQMPEMDGFETVEAIRKEARNELLNIIYITAVCDESTYRVRGVKTGAVDFITKPLIPDIFIGKIQNFLKLYRQRKELEEEILKRNQVEIELKSAKENAEEAALMKQQFLSNMSHEIRTPLNSILNSTHLLLNESPRPDQLDYLDILKFSAESLLQVINAVLDHSRIEAGKIQFESAEFEIRKLLKRICNSFEPELRKKGLRFTLDLGENVPERVIGDAGRLTQILFNLVGNAVKFTQEGEIVLRAGVHAESPDNAELFFQVKDTGIGIPADQQKQIFEAYTQASGSTLRKYGGTGLGLSITRMLVELQGGRLEVESLVNQGSTFTFFLKFGKSFPSLSQLKPTADTEFQSLNGLHILVVEDNPINQKIVCKLLSKWDAAAEVAENGTVAVEKVRQHRYDLILMDLNMPEMSGYEATRIIREMDGEQFRTLPILALTASAFVEDRDKIFSFGMNGYIIKPFSPAELNQKISRFARENYQVN